VKKFKIKSFCKVNLSLRVLKKKKVGYHDIASLITFCNIYDEISISKINRKKDEINFLGKFKNGINKKLNTITKVLLLLRKRNYLWKQNFKISIKKNIPHGSGLGSGSAHAANLLNFFNSKMNLKIKKFEIKKIARKIGFDVPISLEKKNTLLTGERGKILRSNKELKFNILIVYPNIICSTKKIYQRNKKFTHKKYSPNFLTTYKNKIIDYLINENNDLEEIVIKTYPRVNEIINYIKTQKGCYLSRITGSGSACIGIFSNMKTAISAKKMIKLKFPKYWCVVSKTI